jgi:hypothetical protein
LVSGVQKTESEEHKIMGADVKRILEVGRLLLSVLTQAEVELLTRHFRNGLLAHHADPPSVDAADGND